jgi:hypothetical protein
MALGATRGWLWPVLAAFATVSLGAQHGGTASFRVWQRGELVGEADTSVEKTDDGWHITGTNRIAGTIGVTIRQFDATYDARWRPRFLTVESASGGTSTVVHVAALGLTTRTDVVYEKVATWGNHRISPGSIFLPDYAVAAFEVLAARLPTAYEGLEVPLLPAPQSEVFGIVEAVREDPIRTSAGPLPTRRWRLTIDRAIPTTVDIWAHDGRLVRLDFPDEDLSVIRRDVFTPP